MWFRAWVGFVDQTKPKKITQIRGASTRCVNWGVLRCFVYLFCHCESSSSVPLANGAIHAEWAEWGLLL